VAGMGRKTLLSPELQRAIVAAIRAGAYDWVAAEANGIGRNTFKQWMRKGEAQKSGVYANFRAEVLTARAQARLGAEIEVRKDQAFNWLRYGPGREREGDPGWTETKEIKHTGSIDVIHSDEWGRIANVVVIALEPFPDAKLAVAGALRLLAAPKKDDE